ncbi:MAG TPA: lysophospholipid acyltransferase family protein [Prolixibacteraceae bacterium]|nr:lysophospholipid acyltransferase family protein [Prolixibacteraceae bacterium]
MVEEPKGIFSPLELMKATGISVLKLISYLPFPVLYGLSGLFAFILQHVVRYRKDVIVNNLRHAFPDYTDKQIASTVNKFYRHFGDITVETIKAYSLSHDEFKKRITFRGVDLMNSYAEKGTSVILLAMHYNNWELNSFAQVFLKHQFLVVYNPVRGNPRFEKYLLGIRERWGMQTIAVHKSSRAAMEFNLRGLPVVLTLVADQRPAVITRFWTTFLNQEACFYQGPEKIARKSNLPVFFHLTRKTSRGHYEVSFIPLFEKPAEVTEQEILLRYVRTMEKYIREEPAWYLWSHKRWKQQRPEGYPLVDEHRVGGEEGTGHHSQPGQ